MGVWVRGRARVHAHACIHAGEWTEMSLPAAHNGLTHFCVSLCMSRWKCECVRACMGSQYLMCVSGYEWATVIGLV
jgi:hypothetical protein